MKDFFLKKRRYSRSGLVNVVGTKRSGVSKSGGANSCQEKSLLSIQAGVKMPKPDVMKWEREN